MVASGEGASQPLHSVVKGKIAECLVLARLLEQGLEVYQVIADVGGIDFVARAPGGGFVEIQVKGVSASSGPEWFQVQTTLDLDELRRRAYFLVGRTAASEFWVLPATAFFDPSFATISRDKQGRATVDLNLASTRQGAREPNRTRLAQYRNAWHLVADRSLLEVPLTLRTMSAPAVVREELRRKFLPAPVDLVLVGESPPSGGTFFYSRDSLLHDAVRDAFVAVFPEIGIEPDSLVALAARGCYLEDLWPEPLNDYQPDDLRRLWRQQAGEGPLAERMRMLTPKAVAAVMIAVGPNIRRAMALAGCGDLPFRELPFPRPEHRARFVSELAAFLRELHGLGLLRDRRTI